MYGAWWGRAIGWVLTVCWIIAVRMRYAGQLVASGGVLFDVEGFARMCRVSRLFGTGLWVLKRNDHEGWPLGVDGAGSTLSDHLLWVVAWAIRCTGMAIERVDERLGVVLRAGALDYGGGLFSLLVGLSVAGAMLWWVRRQEFGRFGFVGWLIFISLPPLVFATRFAALDESVFGLLFLCWALIFADTGWCSSGWRAVVGGAMAGASLWVAPRFAGPVILLIMTLRGLRSGSRKGVVDSLGWWAVGVVLVLGCACWLDGAAWCQPLVSSGAGRWHDTLGLWRRVEEGGAPWLWFGGMVLIPCLALVFGMSGFPERALNLFRSVAALAAIVASWAMPVWAPVAVVLVLMCAPAAVRGSKKIVGDVRYRMLLQGRGVRRLCAVGAAMLFFWPIARWWDGWLYPSDHRATEALEYREEMAQLRRVAHGLRGGEVQPFLAPWYLSPAVCYWSMQPAVSSFTLMNPEGLEFAVKFYSSPDPSGLRDALFARGVRWIICDAPDRFERNVRRLRLDLPRQDSAIHMLRRGRNVTVSHGFERAFTTGTFVVVEPFAAAVPSKQAPSAINED